MSPSTPSTPLHIVRLDGIHGGRPTFIAPEGYTYTYTEHPTTSPTETGPRLQDADIVITTRVPLTATDLSPQVSPRLKLVAVMAIGTDYIDIAACTARGIPVCNVPAASNEAVAEHAFALFLAARRRVVQLHALTVEGKMWPETGSCREVFGGLPGSWKDEVVGVVGVGELGNRIANIAKVLGMTVLLTERKGIPADKVRPGRTSFNEMLSRSTAIIIACPLTPQTRNLISLPELSSMRQNTILINVARGPIVVEEALLKALKEGWIGGAAVDVYTDEPADASNSLLIREGGNIPNLTLTPHLAWFAQSSIDKLKRTMEENVRAWVEGKPQNLVVE